MFAKYDKYNKNNLIMRKILCFVASLATLVACSEKHAENTNNQTENTQTRYTARMEVAAQQETRAYDSELNWNWAEDDAIAGYQCAGLRLRNQLQYVETAAGFVCEAFEYMSTSPEKFHFIYPAEAEVSEGVLVAPQHGTWQPLSVATVEDAVIASIPMVKFSVLSAALELRIFENDKTTPRPMTAAKLTAEADFVGMWTVNDDLSYTQSLSGTEMVAEGFNSPIVTLNMPDAPEGFAADFFTLVLTDAEGQTMTRTLPAMTFEKCKRTVLNLVFVPDNGQGGNEGGGNEGGEDPDQPDQPVTPDPDQPETITGTFTCATYNVDGLPAKVLGFIDLNGDGPGSDGTKAISQKIATSGWDIVTFQENFTYNSELKSAMSAYYTFGKHRKFSIASALGTADTDGLGFATLNSTCSFSDEKCIEFTDKLGGLLDELDGGNGGGANTSIKKGIRHYVVTFGEPNIVVDVIVTHMNTANTDEQIKVQDKQLKQVAEYINSIRSNNRPIIFMGDMNTRYTRNDYATNFWGVLDSSLTCADPWVEFMWDGVYPTYPSASIMTGDYGMQKGEVVDKIIYINNSNADTQIKANNYLHDESYTFADHKPVVAEFTYVRTVKK